MKAAFLLGFVLLPLGALSAADTAYTALRVLGKRDGQDVLNHVIELHGRGGSPQPSVWKVIIDDPHARGGIREVEIEHGKIISERTPTSHSVGGAMNFNQLNLDSEGAFTIANQEAQKGNLPFDHIDYVLKSGTGGGVPVWELDLADAKTNRSGTIEIAADSGTVLHRDFNSRAAIDDHAYVDGHVPPPPPPPPAYSQSDRDSDNGIHSASDLWNKITGKISHHMEKRKLQLEHFFNGKGSNPDDGR